uniref:phenylalanine--tRNA ligase n=1 Tax=candidate division WOR-3 bacterium TaxID=2052148 RepID=A0A7C4CCL9_UNCW3
MPLVSIPVDRLQRLIGRRLEREELTTALERLGSDVEGYAVMARYRCAACGQLTEALEHEDFNNRCDYCGSDKLSAAGWSEVVRINLLPVRPDTFDAAGLARALAGILGIRTGLPEFEFGASGIVCRVAPGLEAVRPFIACCCARGLKLDEELLRMLMRLQENLHWAPGRDRRRASIGVYNLDAVRPDFSYRPVGPEEVRFVPLFGMPEGMVEATPRDVLERHPKGASYRHLLAGFDRYPLLSDSAGAVLSLPPIINSEATKVTAATRNLFVDVTGPDEGTVGRTLAIIAAVLADLGARVETVAVEYPDGRRTTTPDMAPREATLRPDEACRVLGVTLSPEELAGCLARLRHGATISGGVLRVRSPAYRADLMHDYDLIEDAGIGYGYERVTPRLVPAMTVGRPQPIEETAEVYRRSLTGLGFLETMTLQLTNAEEHLTRLGYPDDLPCVRLENPVRVEGTILRRHLFSGLLSILRVNTTAEMPQHIFEIGDVFEPDGAVETGVRGLRRVGIAMAGPKAGFAEIKAVVEALGHELGIEAGFRAAALPFGIDGRCAEAGTWGVVGEVHPAVLERFGIAQPVAVAELAVLRGE